MIIIPDAEFELIVAWAIDSMPSEYIKNMHNIAFVIEDEPNIEQRNRLHLVNGMTLYGLYEGIPLPVRGAGYNLVLPDKITIFRRPILERSQNMDELREQIKNTVWHEIAHHYGLDHGRIHALEVKKRKASTRKFI